MSESAAQPPHVVILGLMGIGKSTTGAALAAELELPYVDSDVDIQTLTGCSGAEFAAEHGVPLLHRLEAAVLIGALRSEVPSVISAASSTVENPLVRMVVPRRATVIRLTLPDAEVLARQTTGDHRRPMPLEELVALAGRREPFFSELENLRLGADRPTDELVAAIVNYLGGA